MFSNSLGFIRTYEALGYILVYQDPYDFFMIFVNQKERKILLKSLCDPCHIIDMDNYIPKIPDCEKCDTVLRSNY